MSSRSRLAAASLVLSACVLSGCAAADAAAAPAPPTPSPAARVVVTVGDSIMAGFGLDPDAAWPALLGQDAGIDVTNLGCSGAGFTRPGDCGVHFAGLVPRAAAQQPDLVIIQSSDNDARADPAAIDAATATTVRALRAAVPDATIVGLSTLWDQPAAAPATIASSSASLERAVQAVGGVFVDIGQPLAAQDGLLQADDEHPTPAGQRVLLRTIVQALHRSGVEL